jgi:hypothetical protein
VLTRICLIPEFEREISWISLLALKIIPRHVQEVLLMKKGEISQPKVKRICTYCQKEYYKYPSELRVHDNTGGKYCSKECMNASRKKSKSNIICERCGKEFVGYWKRRYCSWSCAQGEPPVMRICEYCKSEFIAHQCNIKLGWSKFCSKSCSLMGENNSSWKGGITTEDEKIRKSDEYKYWRLNVYKRDKFTCQKCKCISTGNNLNAHHQYNFADFPILRTELSNGITLCESCHIDFHHLYGKKYNNPNQIIKFLLEVV